MNTKCAAPPVTYGIVGLLVARHGSTATFEIEQVKSFHISWIAPIDPPLATGERIDVFYESGTAQFLRVGSRYRVQLTGADRRTFVSFVQTAGASHCNEGTTRVDGSSIDTSFWSRWWFRRDVYGAVLVAVVLVLVLVLGFRARSRARESS